MVFLIRCIPLYHNLNSLKHSIVAPMDEEWEEFMNNIDEDFAGLSLSCESTKPCPELMAGSLLSPSPSFLPPTPPPPPPPLDGPFASDLYISTQTKIAYLNTKIELFDLFWRIPIQDYGDPKIGFVKKQVKFNSFSEDEVAVLQAKIKEERQRVQEDIISRCTTAPIPRMSALYAAQQIPAMVLPNPYKDVRKITVGLSRKDLTNHISKRKSAFYNCFIVIMRAEMPTTLKEFKEFHVKVFNTGKIEIPGVQTQLIFESILNQFLDLMKPLLLSMTMDSLTTPLPASTNIHFHSHTDTVLINSNFKCGFYIKRDVLFDLLTKKYGLQCIYDPCSYPGIQCKFIYSAADPSADPTCTSEVYNHPRPSCVKMVAKQKAKCLQVSFMIFRTGSVLIVGMCNEETVHRIYEFLKNILRTEYSLIVQENHGEVAKIKVNRARRKTIFLDSSV